MGVVVGMGIGRIVEWGNGRMAEWWREWERVSFVAFGGEQRSCRAGACAMPEPIPIHTRPGYRAKGAKHAKGVEGMDKRWNGGMGGVGNG